MDTILTGGVSIPRLGFATYRISGGGRQPVVESEDRAAIAACRRSRATSRRLRARLERADA